MNTLQPRFAKMGLQLFLGILLATSVALLLSGGYLLVLGGSGFFALASLVLTNQIAITLMWRNPRWVIADFSLIILVVMIGSYSRFNQLSSYGFLLATLLIPFNVNSRQATDHFSQRIKSIGLAVALTIILLGLIAMQLQVIQQLKAHYQNTSPQAESWQQYGAL